MMTRTTDKRTSTYLNVLTGTLNMYILEDNEEMQKIYDMIFDESEWKIIGKETDGCRALEEIFSLKNYPLVIICDIFLPSISGIEVARKILKRNPNQIIIFTSTNNKQLDDYPDLRDYPRLNKPFFPSDLNKVLKDLTNSSLID